MSSRGLERLRGSRVAIWGSGVEGREVAAAALERDAKLVFVDDSVGTARCGRSGVVEVNGVEVVVRDPAVLSEERFDCVVRSPGVPVYRAELQKVIAAGTEVTSATAMWLEDFAGSRVIAVTGTKGKTTTAWLTALTLEACGSSVRLGGNMGTPLTALYREEPSDFYVVEVSSFQAADVRVSPPFGILTLLAPDHLDWHGTYARYVRDKLNLFCHRPDITIAVSATSPDALECTARFSRRTLYGTAGRVVIGERDLSVDGEPLGLDLDALPLRGRHNTVNLCGAVTASLLATGRVPSGSSLGASLAKMPTLPSRLQTVGTYGKIEFVNDALASNPAGTVAALRTFQGRRVCLIVGGHDRGVDLEPLVQEIQATNPSPAIVYLPDLGERLVRELASSKSQFVCAEAATVREAVHRAAEMLADDGVVLFSPAAPTPNVEGSYVQRGAMFNEAVSELGGSGS